MVSEGICRERESNVFAHISQDLTQHTKAGDASDERNSAAEIFFLLELEREKPQTSMQRSLMFVQMNH